MNELKDGQTRIENRLDRIEIDIKETREDARSAELATAQNSFDIARIKMRMKMA